MTIELLMATYSQSKDAVYEAKLANRPYTQINFAKEVLGPGIYAKKVNY